MPQVKRITSPVATALAIEVSDKIRIIKSEVAKRREENMIETKEYKELMEISKEHFKLGKRASALEKQLEKKFDTNISFDRYDGKVITSIRCSINVDLKRVKSAIIAANHVNNIDVDSVVNYVVKEELKRVEPSCSSY